MSGQPDRQDGGSEAAGGGAARPPARGGTAGRRGEDRRYAEFLPDAQAVMQREHSPLARLLVGVLSLLVLALIAYLAIAEVERVASAEGVVRPAGRVKVVNHPQGGRVSAIRIEEGQRVAEGDVLLELDPEIQREEVAKLTAEWQRLAAEAARLEAEALGATEPAAIDVPEAVARARPDLVATQRDLFAARREALEARRETAEEVIEQRLQEVETLRRRLAQQRGSLEILKEQERSVGELADKGYFPRLRYLSIQRDVQDLEGQIAQSESELERARAALAEARKRRAAIDREWNAEVLDQLDKAATERDRARSSLEQQRASLRNLTVRAPADGVVKDLKVTGLGQSVSANEPLMKVVPVGDSLIVEAQVDNQDIGYIEAGQPAEVKLATYDFTKYGVLEGRVERVSPDATQDQQTGRLLFTVAVRTDKAYLGAEPGRHPVTPGMSAQVDIVIGKRTILDFLTERLRQTTAEAFRER